jgi:hypothetical protein
MPLPFASLLPYTVQILDIDYRAPVCDCVSDTSDTSDGISQAIVV